MIKSHVTIALCLILLGVLFCTPASAEYKRDYTVAKKSFEDADYADAIEKLKSAIADNPESASRVKLYGMRFDSYIPHYYLGQAYFKLNDCPAALAAWQEAINAGVIQEKDEFAQMQTDMKSCKSQGIDVSSIAAQATSDIDALDNAVASYQQLRNEAILASEWSAKWESPVSQAMQLSQTLRQRLAIATEAIDPDAIESISNEARRSAAALGSSERDALAQVAAIKEQNARNQRLAIDSARRDLEEVIRQASATEKPDGGSSQMSSLLADLNRQVNTAQNLGSTASEANIREQTQVINNVLRRYRVSVQDWKSQQQNIARRKPPAELKRIAEAYFAGEYETAASLVKPEDFSEDRARIQALLFRAAANHKLYVRSGEKRSEILRQIKIDIRAIKRMNNNFSPYIAAFSPSFLDLFRQTG